MINNQSYAKIMEKVNSIDSWNLLYEPISQNREDDYFSHKNFFTQYGECKTHNTTLFAFLIIDINTLDVYRKTFSSAWCPEKDKKWLMQVILSIIINIIEETKNNQRKQIREAVNIFNHVTGLSL